MIYAHIWPFCISREGATLWESRSRILGETGPSYPFFRKKVKGPGPGPIST